VLLFLQLKADKLRIFANFKTCLSKQANKLVFVTGCAQLNNIRQVGRETTNSLVTEKGSQKRRSSA